MLRIQPIGYAPLGYPYRPPPVCRPPPPWAAPPEYIAPYSCDVASFSATGEECGCPPALFEQCENRDVLTDLDYLWLTGDKPPLENLSSALTVENALLQRNLLLQTGMNAEHFGILVVFQRFAAKAASLPAVLGAVLASPEYAQHVEKQRQLMGLPAEGGGINLMA